MNRELLYLCIGIMTTLIIFDIINRYRIAKRLKDIEILLNQMNISSLQNVHTILQSIHEIISCLKIYFKENKS